MGPADRDGAARRRAAAYAFSFAAAAGLAAAAGATSVAPLSCQTPPDASHEGSGRDDPDRERQEYAAWIATSATSPRAAIALVPIGPGVRLGPADADIPLDDVPEHQVRQQRGIISLESRGTSRVLPRGLPVPLGRYTIGVDGPAGRAVLAVFDRRRAGKPPTYYDRQPALVLVGNLTPPGRPGTVRVLGADGIEVEAAEAGSVLVPAAGERVRLRVLRFPTGGGDESELEIFFRDATNGHGTYPAGRFVRLTPTADGRYRLDFNRARNPFCAYSSAYPCPAPWRGNTFRGPMAAGERYDGAGLEPAAGAPVTDAAR